MLKYKEFFLKLLEGARSYNLTWAFKIKPHLMVANFKKGIVILNVCFPLLEEDQNSVFSTQPRLPGDHGVTLQGTLCAEQISGEGFKQKFNPKPIYTYFIHFNWKYMLGGLLSDDKTKQ